MARKSPALVQVTTTSVGFGPYQLTDITPAATGYRTIPQAAADGSISTGDEIYYEIVNPTSNGSGKLFERGRGTINVTTRVLTPIAVIERSASLASGGGWGSGSKDVIIMPPGAEAIALLDAANTWLAAQVFNDSVSVSHLSTPQWKLVASSVLRGRLLWESNSTRVDYIDAAGIVKGRAIVGDGTFEFFNGTTTLKVIRFPGGATVKLTMNSAPPTGWTRENVSGERLCKYTKDGTESPGATGGTWTLSGLTTPTGVFTDNYSLTIANLPPHDHQLATKSGGVGGFNSAQGTFESSDAGNVFTSSVGSGTGHSHGISALTIASNGTWRPAYILAIIASLD